MTLVDDGYNEDEVQLSDTGEGSKFAGLPAVSPPVCTKNVWPERPTQAVLVSSLTRLGHIVRVLIDFTIPSRLIICW